MLQPLKYYCMLFLGTLPVFVPAQATQQQTPRQIPVLCYHHVQLHPQQQNNMFISQQNLSRQLQGLHDSGYVALLPQQLVDYHRRGMQLPAKAVLISFDDGHHLQYHLAAPLLDRLQWKAVFFVMTVTLNKKGYMSHAQLRNLQQRGHVIGAHTWNHPNLTHFSGNWQQQLEQPRQQLEHVTGTPVTSFAYPYGAMNAAVVKRLQQSGYACAFQLTGSGLPDAPLFSLRRMMVDGRWSVPQLLQQIRKNFP